MRKIYRLIAILIIACLTTPSLCLPASAQTGRLTCASNDMRYKYCSADTRGDVRLVRQISGSPCDQNYSWGYDYRGIWVDRGCRAEFEYGRTGGDHAGRNAAIAGGILGAILIGAAVSSSRSKDKDSSGGDPYNKRQYYLDGYRLGQRDWDDNKNPYWGAYRDRFPPQYENDFTDGYDDGYNNRRKKYN